MKAADSRSRSQNLKSAGKAQEYLDIAAALVESKRHAAERAALLDAAKVVLNYQDFNESAKRIFESLRELTGAKAGYVALLSKDGSQNEVVFLEPGGFPCTVDPALPMPVRGLRAEASNSGKVVYENDFAKSRWMEYMPEGHLTLESVLFAPLVIEGKTVGLIGLGQKEGGFTEHDAAISEAFGEFAAIALRNSRLVSSLKEAEHTLRQARDELEIRVKERTAELEKAAFVIANAGFGVAMTDPSTNTLIFVNPAYAAQHGFAAGELVGQPVCSVCAPECRQKLPEVVSRLEADGQYTYDSRHVRKDGGTFPVLVNTALIKAEKGKSRYWVMFVQDMTEIKAKDEAIRASEQQLRLLSSELLVAQEKERKRVAQELHDGVGQYLTATKIQVHNLLDRMPEDADGDGVSCLGTAMSMLQQSIDEVKRIQRDLRPPVLDDLGIIATIEWFSRTYQSTYPGIKVEKLVRVEEQEVPEDLKTVIYRILQEAMNNVAKHSKADRVRLELRAADGALTLTICDNGKGLDLETVQADSRSRGAMGLASMWERAQLSGGEFSIESAPGAGTTLTVSWIPNRTSHSEQG